MTLSRNQHIAAIVVAGAAFAILTSLVLQGETDRFDVALRSLALSYNTPAAIVVWEGISFMGSVGFLVGLTCLIIGLFAVRRDWPAASQLAIAMSGAVILNIALKWMVHRARPEEIYAHTMPASFSFPSGHALYSLTFYVTIAMIFGPRIQSGQSVTIWIAALLMAGLIGTSRIFLGVHYGSDVLGGYLVAAVWLLCLTIPTASGSSRFRHKSSF